MTKKRLNELSYMNLLFCILVILIHVLSEPYTRYDRSTFQFFAIAIPHRLSSFVVQGFLFLSGLKMYKFWKTPFKPITFWSKKIKSIFAPYLLWVIIYYCFFLYLRYFPFNLAELVRYTLNGTLVSPFYFIVVLFQFYLLSPVFVWLTNKVNAWLLIISSTVISFVSTRYLSTILSSLNIIKGFKYSDRTFTTYMIYFVLGCIIAKYYDKICDILVKNKIVVYLTFAVSAIAEIIISYVIPRYVGVDVVEFYHIVYCVITIFFTLTLFSSIKQKDIHPFIAAADQATYLVYLSHCLFLFVINSVMNRIGITSTAIRFGIRFIFVYTAAFSMSMLWQYFKNLLLARKTK